MSTDITEEQWKVKYFDEKKKFEELEKQFDLHKNFYETKLAKFEIQTKQLSEANFYLQKSYKKCENKKQQISLLKDAIEYKNKEILELKVDLDNANEKIAKLRRHRHQSVMEIRDLEVKLAEDHEKMSFLVQTPRVARRKDKRKKLTTQKLASFCIKAHRKNSIVLPLNDAKAELEKLLEDKDDELLIEMQRNNELNNVLMKLKHEFFKSTEEVKSLFNQKSTLEKLLEEMKQSFQSKLETFTEKNAFLIRENEDLKRNLREYQERDSGFNTSEHDSIGNLGDELLKVSGGSKFIEKNIEDYLRVHEFPHFQLGENQMVLELKRKNQNLEDLLKISNSQCKKIKEKLTKYRKVSEILNKKLKENIQAMEFLKDNYSNLILASEVQKLTEEKNRLQEEIAKYKSDLSSNSTRGSCKKLMINNKSYLEDLPNNGPMDLLNKPYGRIYNNERKRRGMASWSYTFINPIN